MNTQEIVASTEEMMSPATMAVSPPWAIWSASLAAWLNRCADQWTAAAAYEEELRRVTGAASVTGT